jgi:5-methylcytosine-specific restriction endonuclease McrA
MPAAGKWKTEIGWEQIDNWHEEGFNYVQIRTKCSELSSDGSAPSKGSLAPHFNLVSRTKIYERTKKYRSTILGMLNRRIHDAIAKDDKSYQEPKENRHTSVYEMLKERFKDLKGKNGMESKKYVDYWKKNENLTIVDQQVDWRMPCKICGEELIIEPKGKDMQLDHIVPHSRQGKSTPDNIIPVHKMCNQAKSSMTMEELIELSKKVVKTHG